MQTSLEQTFTEFMYECEFARKVRPQTLIGYRCTFTTLCKLIPNATLSDLTPSTIIQFFKILDSRSRLIGKGHIKIGVKKSTIASYWSKLNSFFSWLLVKGYIKVNPFASMKYPTPSYEDKKYLKKEEIERILTALHLHNQGNILLFKRNLVLFHLLLFCGLRKEEVMLLQIRDVDILRKLITIRGENSKSGKTRYIPLHSDTLMQLKDYFRERAAYTTPFVIISSMRDDKLSYDGLRHLVDSIRKRSGIQFHLHQFRHTFAVNFLKATNNIFKLQTLLGHSDIRSTTLYLRCMPPEELRQDIESMSIDRFMS